jgi:hypothetical protein
VTAFGIVPAKHVLYTAKHVDGCTQYKMQTN